MASSSRALLLVAVLAATLAYGWAETVKSQRDGEIAELDQAQREELSNNDARIQALRRQLAELAAGEPPEPSGDFQTLPGVPPPQGDFPETVAGDGIKHQVPSMPVLGEGTSCVTDGDCMISDNKAVPTCSSGQGSSSALNTAVGWTVDATKYQQGCTNGVSLYQHWNSSVEEHVLD